MSLLLASLLLSFLAILAGRLVCLRDPAGSPILTLTSLLFLLALPLLMLLPKFTLEIAPAQSQTAAIPGSTLPLFYTVWLIGFLFCSFKLLRDYLSLRKWFASSHKVIDSDQLAILANVYRQLQLTHPVELRLCQTEGSPCIAGLTRPVIYLPRESTTWSQDTLRMVLLHELSHFARRDLWTSLAARLACLVHWFNPFVWKLRKHLLAQCEYACDAHVISTGADPASYVDALCDVAESPQQIRTSLAMAGSAPLRQRVERLAKNTHQKQSLLVGTILFATATASLALAVVRLSPPHSFHPDYPADEIELRLTADPFPGK